MFKPSVVRAVERHHDAEVLGFCWNGAQGCGPCP